MDGVMSWPGTSAEHAASLTGFPSWNVRTGLRVFGGLHKGELAVRKVLAPSIHQYHTKSLIQGERLHPDYI